ncbi:MAG: o-succinylbenzoate synthase [Actinobacteria bacterium 69-20]|jgi:O-succinylbenzoate synthase|nr:o-succinylbenzoate synthase [Actinomycetota bacterium]OJV24719.1 MAG: o-succinylbenzoate synthase [Actinobacteria bacterium 69-20]
MKLTAAELVQVRMPLVTPFETSFGVQAERDVLLVRMELDGQPGWGECVTLPSPVYSPEFSEAAATTIRRFLVPALAGIESLTASKVAAVLEPFKGHRMAKAALELAVLDAQLRCVGMSLADYLGAVHATIPSGVSVGIQPSVAELLDVVAGYLDAGYVRIKLKIKPGWDIEPVRAVRERFGDIPLQVDANTAYRLADARHLARLDEFDLLLIEQPLEEEDLTQHAELARQLRTPVCLDESITSAKSAADAIRLGATGVVNIKAGRVGGYLQARQVHDVCAASGVPVWCGGMLETGIGRAANMALAALPGFTLPGDTSASDRFYSRDIITEPFVLSDGHIAVPTGPGLGVEVDEDALAAVTVHRETVPIRWP